MADTSNFKHGVPYRISPRVRRLVAPNPGVMTGPGTNSYLIGSDEITVVDPGPAIDSHIDAILSAVGDKLKYIITTHTHRDHSPAWRALKQASGARVIGARPWDDTMQDESFDPDKEPTDGELVVEGEYCLRAVHTPGHVGNHYCFLLEGEQLLFAGDHIMNGSTVVIVPPSGDMKAYLESLRKLLDCPLKAIAPGHGDLINQPVEAVEALIAHRLKRENKVLESLLSLGRSSVDDLVVRVYDDVDSKLHRMARLSLTAHLIKLEQDGRVVADAARDNWECV